MNNLTVINQQSKFKSGLQYFQISPADKNLHMLGHNQRRQKILKIIKK